MKRLAYRLWDSKGATASPARAKQWGAFWAETNFSSESAARSNLAVCREWNFMDKLTVCDLPVGAKVAIGPGQTAKCASGKTLAGGPLQVVVVDPDKKLKNCKTTNSGY